MRTNRYKTTPRMRRMLLIMGAAVAAVVGIAPVKAAAVPQPVPLPHVPVPTALPTVPHPSVGVPTLPTPGAPTLGTPPRTNPKPINGGSGNGNCLANGGTGRQDVQTGSIFDGWIAAPGGVVGGVYSKIDTYLNTLIVNGQIVNYGPYVDPDGDVSAWTALSDGAPTHIYQIGYGKTAGQTNIWAFYELHDPGSPGGQPLNKQVLLFTLTGVNSQPHFYTTLYDPVGQHFSMQYDGTTYYNNDGFFTPLNAQVMGENHDLNDQMVGGATDAVHFASTSIYSNGWGNMNGTTVNQLQTSTPAGWGNQTVDGSHFYIWDKACVS